MCFSCSAIHSRVIDFLSDLRTTAEFPKSIIHDHGLDRGLVTVSREDTMRTYINKNNIIRSSVLP